MDNYGSCVEGLGSHNAPRSRGAACETATKRARPPSARVRTLSRILSKPHIGTGRVRISAGLGRNLAKFMLPPGELQRVWGLLKGFDDESSPAEPLAGHFSYSVD